MQAAAPFEVSGSVREHVSGSPLVAGGEVEFLAVADLVPVALQALTNGQFDLLVPPGEYILLIQPDSSTRFATYTIPNLNILNPILNPITVDKNLRDQTYLVEKPTLLTGIVEVEQPGAPSVPMQAYLEFYAVTSTAEVAEITLPVGTAVTDSQGRWSVPGPPASAPAQ